MKHCTNCGASLPAGVKFCPHCGQKIESVVPTHAADDTVDHAGDRSTPRLPIGEKQSSRKRNNGTVLVVLAVLVILGGIYGVKKRLVVSRDQLAENLTTAVQKEDGKLFLKQFSKDEQKLKFSDVGAQSVVKDMHNHSRDSLSEVGRIIVDGQRVTGTEVKYHFNVESKKVLGVFTSYYLTTRRSPVELTDLTGSGGSVTVKLKDKQQRVSKQQLQSGFFPGKYTFDIQSGDTQGDYWIWASGDGETIDLTLTAD